MAADGGEIAHTNLAASSSYRPPLIYSEDEGWVVFVPGPTYSLTSYRVTPAAGKLIVEAEPYPTVEISPYIHSENLVAPFGPGRYLIARYGVAVLTASGATRIREAATFPPQSNSAVTASPFGYLVIWNEVDSSVTRGLRFGVDGTPLDEHSFVIAPVEVRKYLQCVFDGRDYIVWWPNAYATPFNLARIAPNGVAEVRLQKIALPESIGSVSLVVQQTNLFVFTSPPSKLRMWRIFPTGAVGPETSPPGQFLVSDGANLVGVGVNNQSQIFRTQLGSLATNIIGSGSLLNAQSLKNGFAALWTDEGAYRFAYFSHGAEILRGQPPLPSFSSFAESADRILVITGDPFWPNRYVFRSYNLRSGNIAAEDAELGTLYNLHVASAGKDFLAVTDSIGPVMEYTGKIWITGAEAPLFSVPQISDTKMKSALVLRPERRYRIESSPDLINWTLQQVIGGVSAFEITTPLARQGFVRAILIPE